MAKKRRRARKNRVQAFLLLATGAILLISIALAFSALASRAGGTADPAAARSPSPTLMAIPTPSPTPGPTATPRPAVELPTVEPVATVPLTPEPDVFALSEDDYLPVVKKADTDKKVIAITVDDLYQSGNTRTIVDLAIKYGGKLTLFPVGENALREELAKTLRYAYDNGMEIENHTYEHKGLYALDDEAMARQMYLQSLAVNYVLGVDYQQHFFRPYGGDGLDDQRTHLYAKQMGMRAIAYWSVSGSDTPADSLLGTLAPGNVYLFHSTDSDTKKLKKFIPAAVKAGYKLVTLNELFGLKDNEVSKLETPVRDREIMPVVAYRLAPRAYKKGDYLWGVNLLQRRLVELGYLAKADGIYGDSTSRAISAFQQANGLSATGKADLDTQDALFSPTAKASRKK